MSARGVFKKSPNTCPREQFHFFPGFGGGEKVLEKMKSRFVVPNRRNVILFNV